jgi:hypothetical protein
MPARLLAKQHFVVPALAGRRGRRLEAALHSEFQQFGGHARVFTANPV